MEKTNVKIISFMNEGERVSASGAKISNTSGNAIDIFNSSNDASENQNLINKVVTEYGHTSFTEHMVFTLAFSNVSAVVEQFMIEFRLVSPSVKSRRYVDFTSQGFVIPDDIIGDDRDKFANYAKKTFNAYAKLINLGIPREDARFILPYCFADNFYLTLNARSLVNVIEEIRFGKGKKIPELQSIADSIITQIKEICPSVLSMISDKPDLEYEDYDTPNKHTHDPMFIECGSTRSVFNDNFELLPIRFRTAHTYAHPTHEGDIIDTDFKKIILNNRGRELEILSVNTIYNDISLAGLTHLERHRMQSLIIPSLFAVECGTFIYPKTIIENTEARDIYTNTVTEINNYRAELIKNDKYYQIYFCLAGNTTDVLSTMNLNELRYFFALRSCERAQWEIRTYANEILNFLKDKNPDIFKYFGPSCTVYGKCPEGKMSCGNPKFINDGGNI